VHPNNPVLVTPEWILVSMLKGSLQRESDFHPLEQSKRRRQVQQQVQQQLQQQMRAKLKREAKEKAERDAEQELKEIEAAKLIEAAKAMEEKEKARYEKKRSTSTPTPPHPAYPNSSKKQKRVSLKKPKQLDEKFIISISNFTGKVRESLIKAIMASGATYTTRLGKTNTHLICQGESGQKYNSAKLWEIEIVGEEWLFVGDDGENSSNNSSISKSSSSSSSSRNKTTVSPPPKQSPKQTPKTPAQVHFAIPEAEARKGANPGVGGEHENQPDLATPIPTATTTSATNDSNRKSIEKLSAMKPLVSSPAKPRRQSFGSRKAKKPVMKQTHTNETSNLPPPPHPWTIPMKKTLLQ